MKNILVTLVVLASIALLPACKKENIPSFNAAPSIYFLDAAQWGRYNAGDSLLTTFGYSADDVTDSIVRIPISVLGKTSTVDRAYKIMVLDAGTTAKAGQNYDLPATTVIHAGLSTDWLAITVHRTPDILYNPLTLMLQLSPNENFRTDMTIDTADGISGKPVHYTIFKLIMQDGLTQPDTWGYVSFYFGPFSAKKLKLINQLTGMPLDALSTYDTEPSWIYWATVTNRYLLDQKAAGTPVLEDDGTPMTLGRALTQ